MLRELLDSSRWQVVKTIRIDERPSRTVDPKSLSLSPNGERFLQVAAPNGIYTHQHMALSSFQRGNHVCIATGTASGKSLVFYLAAIEQLSRSTDSRVLALYPLKALGREQEDRWKQALSAAGIPAHVGRIDGSVSPEKRKILMRNSKILIFTPDVVHAWLMANLNVDYVRKVLSAASLIVLDEVHNYAGVFGSNMAFLLRRLQHVMDLLGVSPRFICASATIANPQEHLQKLTGLSFDVVGPEHDGSPKHPTDIHLTVPPRSADLLTEVSQLLKEIATKTNERFIAFVDSRKQTEHIAAIIARASEKSAQRLDHVDDEEIDAENDYLLQLDVLPYRAGYEETDRAAIQERLSTGSLRGVVSTSALELGIDIPHLDVAVLVGVPRSLTSFYQRIGRVGRHKPGTVVVINSGDVFDEVVFRNPDRFLERPLAESTLYLDNARIQYIHALCLARQGGEHDTIIGESSHEDYSFSSKISWPPGFIELCERERRGEVPGELRVMKTEAGEEPNRVFPLRDVESQFKVELKDRRDLKPLGELSYAQVMREAYPGAVYYYLTRPYRVYKVDTAGKQIYVRAENKRYTTHPISLPTMVFPDLTPGNVFAAKRFGNLVVVECSVQVREALSGFRERRGPNELPCTYPFDYSETGVRFNLKFFTRHYFTTGVVISHPRLNEHSVDCVALANLLYESFLYLVPYERTDIRFASDKWRTTKACLREGDRFICVYDQTYGSLRLSGRILQDTVLQDALRSMIELLSTSEHNADTETARYREIVMEMFENSQEEPVDLTFESAMHSDVASNLKEVLLPGSKGIDISQGNIDFVVEHVFYNPRMSSICYRGKRANVPPETDVILPIDKVVGVPGESKVGYYNLETGEIIKDLRS